jgi:hypothetical protein
MTKKSKIYFSSALIALLGLFGIALKKNVVNAAVDPFEIEIVCNDGSKVTAKRTGAIFTTADYAKACGTKGYTDKTAATKIDTECDNINDPSKPCQMLVYLKNGINFLSAVAGIAITFSLIWAGYQYMTARANAGIVTAAKNKIIMTLVALLLYIFMYAILNWLIPGGLFP